LIVTQNTADPVGLLYGGSDSDTVANPVANVLSQLADPDTKEEPVFAGDAGIGPHPVAACTMALPQAATPEISTMAIPAVSANVLRTAISAREAHLPELLAAPEVQAVGVGASRDNPQEPAILLFVNKGRSRVHFPAQVGGVRTRIVEGNFEGQSGSLSAAGSAALEPTAVPPALVYEIPQAEVVRARAVHAAHVSELLKRRGIQGVGIGSSLDSPGEAALVVFVIRGISRDPIPSIIDGLRTRIRESSRFRAR
jgi:hypothetical protein